MKARALVGATVLLAGCSHLPLGYLDATSPIGGRLAHLGWGLLAISVVVSVIISALVLAGSLRARYNVGDENNALAVRRDAGGMRWIYLGVGISCVFLAGSVIWTLFTLKAVAQPVGAVQPLKIDIRAHQWWWQADYGSDLPSDRFSTANELHVPVGVPIELTLRSDDVIHSFWVPKLAGKMDVIPGIANTMWIEATRPGVYRGQCAEYCGVEHALMGFNVIADPAPAYRQWHQRQLAGKSLARDYSPGAAVFGEHCSACHAIRGTSYGGSFGPDLTNLGERRTLAAGVLENTPQNLAHWIAQAQAVKPGTRMPNVPLPSAQMRQLVAYLERR